MRAAAMINGIIDQAEIEGIVNGSANAKLSVPKHLRALMLEMGIAQSLKQVKLFQLEGPSAVLMADEAWKDV